MRDLLAGIRVLDLTRLLPGPYATLLLADLGAEVIKIEEPSTGDPVRWTPPFVNGKSYRFLLLNRNKKSLTLNLKNPQGREIFLKLAHTADAILEGFRPGAVQRLGIDYEAVRKIKPDIIYGSLTGFGQEGPYRERVGHDINYISIAGLLSLTGHEKPVIPGVPVADLAGGMFAALTLLAALIKRNRSLRGAYIDLSMTDCVLSFLGIHAAEYFATGQSLKPSETVLTGGFPCYAIYETKEGKFITIGALEEKFWANLCRALGKEEYTPYQFSLEKREEIFASFKKLFKSRTRDEWLAFFDQREIPIAPVNDLKEAFDDPQIRHRGLLIETENKKIKQIGFPAKYAESFERQDQLAPALGEHTDEILRALGCNEKQLEKLRREGVI